MTPIGPIRRGRDGTFYFTAIRTRWMGHLAAFAIQKMQEFFAAGSG